MQSDGIALAFHRHAQYRARQLVRFHGFIADELEGQELSTAMNRLLILLIVGISIISTVPLYAQRQQQNVAKLKADAKKVVSIISGDKAKTQSYCEARDIATQIVQAGQQKDKANLEELADKLTEQQKNLGSEYLALMESLRNASLTSKDGQEIESLFDELDESCPH